MLKHIDGLHAQIGGGYAMGPKIIIDAAELSPNKIEVMTLNAVTGDEIEVTTVTNEADAQRVFHEMIQRHAEPLQAAFDRAGMQYGHEYTIFHLGEFGFPIAQKITFHKMELTTYAQHRDAVHLMFTPCGKRRLYGQHFYNQSFIICAGWHTLDETKIKKIVTDTPQVKATLTKYAAFDARYIEDAEAYLPDILVVHKAYKNGVNGKIYA